MLKCVMVETVTPPFGGKPRYNRREFAHKMDRIKKLIPLHIRGIPDEAIIQLFQKDKCEWIDKWGNRHEIELRELRMNKRNF